MNYCPFVYAKGVCDCGIRGRGIFDGQGSSETWTAMGSQQGRFKEILREKSQQDVPVEQRVFGKGFNLRPSFLEFFDCQRVLIEGIEIRNGPMWSVHPVLCKGVTIRGVTILNTSANGDGIDPDMSTD